MFVFWDKLLIFYFLLNLSELTVKSIYVLFYTDVRIQVSLLLREEDKLNISIHASIDEALIIVNYLGGAACLPHCAPQSVV